MTATIARRLATLEARLPPIRPTRSPLALDRLTPDERDDLAAITTRTGRDAAGRLDLEALTDADLERLEALLRKAWGDATL